MPFILAILVILLCGCCLSHEWEEATCTALKTCAKCEKTEGEPLAHTWTEATCTTRKTCSVCGDTISRTLDRLELEYHWGEPVEFGNVTVEFYMEGDMFCFRMEGPYISATLMKMLEDDEVIPDMHIMSNQIKRFEKT